MEKIGSDIQLQLNALARHLPFVKKQQLKKENKVGMTIFEKASIAQAIAFLEAYGYRAVPLAADEPPMPVSRPPEMPMDVDTTPIETSNGIPVCHRHGKEMKLGNYGYYCTAKENDPRYANKNGYCKAKG